MHSLDFFLASICLHISMLDEFFPFLMNSLLDESCIPFGMMNFRLFKLDAHLIFFLYHIARISRSLISTHLSCLLGELYQLASKLQGRLLLNMGFKHAYFEFSHLGLDFSGFM